MHSDDGYASPLPAPRRSAARQRLLAGIALTAAVLLAHLALLQARPPRVAPHATPLAQQTFRIRAVDAESIRAAAAPALIEAIALEPTAHATDLPTGPARTATRSATDPGLARTARATSRRVQKLEQNGAKTQAESAQYAINSIANTVGDAVSAPSARQASDTAPEAPDPIVAAVPAPAASAPSAAPQRTVAQAVQATAFRFAAPVRLDYEVQGQIRGIPYQAQAELLWRHDADHYDAQLAIEVPLIGTRRQTSAGSIGALGLEPTRFSDKARSELAAHFVRPANGSGAHVVFSANTPQVALAPGAQDRLSVFLQLGAMLAAAPGRYPRGSTITLQIVGPRDADLWRFEVGTSERLALPYGEVDATQLSRAPPRDYDTRVDLWLAPSLDWLPVRILLTRPRGERLDLRLRALGSPD